MTAFGVEVERFPRSGCAHRDFIHLSMREYNVTLFASRTVLVPSMEALCVMQEVSSCTVGHKRTRLRLQRGSKGQHENSHKGRAPITIADEDEPPPSNVVNFSAGKMETFSSSNLYQSSSSSSIVLCSDSVAWLALGWKTLFLTNPM